MNFKVNNKSPEWTSQLKWLGVKVSWWRSKAWICVKNVSYISAVFEFMGLLYLLQSLSLSSSFTMQKGKRIEEKAKSFSRVTFVKKVDLTVNHLFFLWPGKGNYHVGKPQVIFRNTRYKVQWAVKNATYLNALELCNWQFAYCCKWEASADSDTFSPVPYRKFLDSHYRCSFHPGSETTNKICTVTSAPIAKPQILQFLMECKLGVIMDFKHVGLGACFKNEQDIHLRIPAWKT